MLRDGPGVPATGASTFWGQDAPGTCRGARSLILAVPALGICPSDAPPGAGGRDKATCTQVSPQTSTMTSFLTCFKGVGVGTGASLSQKTFGALGIQCPREAPSVPGAGLGLVTRTVPWTLRATAPEPQAGVWRWGQGGSWSGGECGGARCPGSASPLIHSCSHSHSWAPLPGGCRWGRLGCRALVLRPLPSGEHPRPRCCCLPSASMPGPRGPSQVGAGVVPRVLPAGLPGERGYRPQWR